MLATSVGHWFQMTLDQMHHTHLLWKYMYANCVLVCFGPQLDLGQSLVSEGVAHDKGWMSLPTAQVHQSPLGKEDHMAAIRQGVPVDLNVMNKGLRERMKSVTDKAL